MSELTDKFIVDLIELNTSLMLVIFPESMEPDLDNVRLDKFEVSSSLLQMEVFDDDFLFTLPELIVAPLVLVMESDLIFSIGNGGYEMLDRLVKLELLVDLSFFMNVVESDDDLSLSEFLLLFNMLLFVEALVLLDLFVLPVNMLVELEMLLILLELLCVA